MTGGVLYRPSHHAQHSRTGFFDGGTMGMRRGDYSCTRPDGRRRPGLERLLALALVGLTSVGCGFQTVDDSEPEELAATTTDESSPLDLAEIRSLVEADWNDGSYELPPDWYLECPEGESVQPGDRVVCTAVLPTGDFDTVFNVRVRVGDNDSYTVTYEDYDGPDAGTG